MFPRIYRFTDSTIQRFTDYRWPTDNSKDVSLRSSLVVESWKKVKVSTRSSVGIIIFNVFEVVPVATRIHALFSMVSTFRGKWVARFFSFV